MTSELLVIVPISVVVIVTEIGVGVLFGTETGDDVVAMMEGEEPWRDGTLFSGTDVSMRESKGLGEGG